MDTTCYAGRVNGEEKEEVGAAGRYTLSFGPASSAAFQVWFSYENVTVNQTKQVLKIFPLRLP